MKKIYIFLFLLSIAIKNFSQDTKPQLTKADYLEKSKRQKSNAWVLLSGGTALCVAGILIINHSTLLSPDPTKRSDFGLGIVLGLIGMVGVLTSIPEFAASGQNKRKAMSLSFKNETPLQIYKCNFVYRPLPSLTLKINL